MPMVHLRGDYAGALLASSRAGSPDDSGNALRAAPRATASRPGIAPMDPQALIAGVETYGHCVIACSLLNLTDAGADWRGPRKHHLPDLARRLVGVRKAQHGEGKRKHSHRQNPPLRRRQPRQKLEPPERNRQAAPRYSIGSA